MPKYDYQLVITMPDVDLGRKEALAEYVTEKTSFSYEKKASAGTEIMLSSAGLHPEKTHIANMLIDLSAQQPDLTLTLLAMDLDDRVDKTKTVIANGGVIAHRHARLISPEQDYDEQTVEAIADYISTEHGLHTLAATILHKFDK